MMKRTTPPHIAGIVVVLPYIVLLILAWLPMVTGPAEALEGIGVLILTAPTSMILCKIADAVSIATTSHRAATGLGTAIFIFSAALHAALLYFAAWGITTIAIEKGNPNNASEATSKPARSAASEPPQG